MKSLNDTLREEFDEILNKDEYKKTIEQENLDKSLLIKAFNSLLKYKSDINSLDKSKTEFENFLINYFKIKKNDNK
jgi:hypothetical protein